MFRSISAGLGKTTAQKKESRLAPRALSAALESRDMRLMFGSNEACAPSARQDCALSAALKSRDMRPTYGSNEACVPSAR